MSKSQSKFEVRSVGRPVADHESVFEPILDTEEAATLLRMHPKTLQKMARSGEIPAFRIGKGWGFRASMLNKWLETRVAS